MIYHAKELKYMKMAEKFRSEILSGAFPPGSKLPPDDMIAQAYGVNKRTVAAGMAQLVAEGLITRTPGRGSIVVRQKIVDRHTDAVCCISWSMGDVFMTMQKEITSQTLKRSFYPVWIPESLFDLGTTRLAPDNKEFIQFMEYTVNNMPHGVLIWGERFIPYDMLERNLAKCGRLVFFGDYVHTKEIPAKYVLIDYDAAAQKVVSCFQKNGHKKITLLTSPVIDIDKYNRKPPQYFYHKALERACADAGVEYDSEIPKLLWLSKPQEEIFQTILRRKITGAAMVSDAVYYAYCADTIQKMKIRIPDDLSLIGFFDVKDRAPDLTTLNIQEHKIATITADMLFEKSDEVQKIFVPPELIERKTVKNLNQAGH